ncbi:hypothetical protein TSAR_013263 [Trichomalopsis sarcophagae]|uniref:Peptidase M14 domain-containing protein n=1 Tax=Trichomalopsis sarcophagae TaxID=543379 RepID=A0A232EFF3_9HYME|nr:hypothetical protein TSAR_013263 [Trichomalopsis sarcophagae]
MHSIITLLLMTATIAAAEKVSYENYKVFQMVIKKDDELKFLKDLVESRDDLSFWSGPSGSIPTDIMVAAKALDYFTEHINDSGIKYEKFVDNVEALIERQKAGKETIFGWKSYHTLDEIYDWFDNLPMKYSGKVETIIGGHTYEGREIKGVKISHNSNKPGIFMEGGIHAWDFTGHGYIFDQRIALQH